MARPDIFGPTYFASRAGSAHARDKSRACGMTLIEAVMATAVVGTMLVAAFSTVGASRLSQFRTSQRIRGQQLAADLMAEIVCKAYEEPDGTPSFGRESGESGRKRDRFDDVDDYYDWSASPPTYEDGTTIPGFDGWKRSVTVEWVDPMNPGLSRGFESGAKRISVSVSRNNMLLASIVAVRSASGW